MPWSPRLTALALVLAACAFAPGHAVAQQDERCSGTFCDFYYGGPPPEKPANAPQAAPTPLTVPRIGGLGSLLGGSDPAPAQNGSAPVPAKRPFVAVQGGGLLGMARGEPAERCSGTFCDFYYGGPPPEKPAAPAAQPGNSLAPEQAADQDATPEPAAEPPAPELVERPQPQQCAAKGSDPWSCYRR